MTPNLSHTLATLERAESEVSAAEQELVNLLSAIQVAPRAEKTSVSQIVEVALRRLRSALVSVEGAKKELAAADAPPNYTRTSGRPFCVCSGLTSEKAPWTR